MSQILKKVLVQHKHTGIFVHVPKTAGQSVRSALEHVPAIITELKRPEFGWFGIETHVEHARKGFAVYLRELFGLAHWDQLFSFGFVRNPYDRAVSNWKYFSKRRIIPEGITLYEYLKLVAESDIHSPGLSGSEIELLWHAECQWKQVCDQSGEIMLTIVGRFESLDADFGRMCDAIDIPPPELPKLNRSNFAPFQMFLDSRSEEMIRKLYREDFEILGYEQRLVH